MIGQIDPAALAALGPLVVPLIVAVIGLMATIFGTISGVIITQRRSDQREKIAWDRQREREREQWAREDAARTFELRRENYVELYEAVAAERLELTRLWREHAESGSVEPGLSSEEASRRTDDAYKKLTIYGSAAVNDASSELYKLIVQVRRDVLEDVAKSAVRLEIMGGLEEHLLNEIRVDLGIPEGASAKERAEDQVARLWP